MKAKWLIESAVFERAADNSLMKSLDSQGIEYRLVHGAEEKWGVKSYLDLFDKDDCVVVRGSIEFCAMASREAPWVPGVFMDMDSFDCTKYYPVFGNLLLNEDYMMLPYGELRRRKDWLYEKMGEADSIFIRPNRGNKIFKGTLVHKEYFDKDIDRLGFYGVPAHELCVVAAPINILTEWRYVVVNGKVITGSQYMSDGKLLDESIDATQSSFIPQSWLDGLDWEPEKAWVIDMAMVRGDGRPRLLEIGAFSCCGLYGCNTDIIVRGVSELALAEWKEHYES